MDSWCFCQNTGNHNDCRIKAVNEKLKRTGCLTWTGAHGVPLHTLSEGEGGHVGVGVDALLHVAAPHTLRAAAGAFAARAPHGARCPALLGTVVGWGTFYTSYS